MIGSFRNFAKTKFAGILVFIMIIPFVFWGMGSMFSSGNTNTIAKINKTNISTEDFIDYLNNSGIPQETIRERLNNNIIEELLSGLISTTLLNLEIKNHNLIITEKTLLNIIKKNEIFFDENGKFKRTEYEKFLLKNNQSAPQFESRLKKQELQKNLFDYIGAGTLIPKFLVNKLYQDENLKLEIDFINLSEFYKEKESFTDKDLQGFIEENQDQLQIEYIDFQYTIINPKKIIGVDEFNQSFFDKIDQIEIDIANDVKFEKIAKNLNILPIVKKRFKLSSNDNEIEKKIYNLKNNKFDLFELGDDYVLYEIEKIYEEKPDIKDAQTKKEIKELIFQKNKFDYNRELFERIKTKKFNDKDFLKMANNRYETIKFNSVKDNKKFEMDSIKLLYSLPLNSFTLINDHKDIVYLAKIRKFENVSISENKDEIKKYYKQQNSKMKNDMLKSYDFYLNSKYKVNLNQKTVDRVKNFFQ